MSELNSGSSDVRRTRRNCNGPKSFKPHSMGVASISIHGGLGRDTNGLTGYDLLSASSFAPVRIYVAKYRQVLNRFADAVVGDVICGWFGPEIRLIPHVLLDESILVMTADHRIGQIQIFNFGLQFARMISADFMAEDDGEFVGLADRAVRIQQSLTEPIHGRPAGKDQVIAQFNLRE